MSERGGGCLRQRLSFGVARRSPELSKGPCRCDRLDPRTDCRWCSGGCTRSRRRVPPGYSDSPCDSRCRRCSEARRRHRDRCPCRQCPRRSRRWWCTCWSRNSRGASQNRSPRRTARSADNQRPQHKDCPPCFRNRGTDPLGCRPRGSRSCPSGSRCCRDIRVCTPPAEGTDRATGTRSRFGTRN